ncbi:MAG: energy-coupled thiamine transporter ThiT [Clostridia bacterium]|nr:energy-coupled thiamine transporter ThiT [Clostridia bacterium]
MKKKSDSLKKLAVCAMMVALSFVLSLWAPLKFWPQGGSVTLGAMVPVILVALLFGTKWGLGCALVNALLQLMMGFMEGMGTWGLSPLVLVCSILLDYILAYTVIGLAGIFKGNDSVRAILGTVFVCILRYACHFVSGWAFFGMWAEEGYTALSWALFYNMSYMLPETVITLVLAGGLAALLPILRKNFSFCRDEKSVEN